MHAYTSLFYGLTIKYLQSSPFGFEGKGPGAISELHDEDFACFGEKDWSLRGDHLKLGKIDYSDIFI